MVLGPLAAWAILCSTHIGRSQGMPAPESNQLTGSSKTNLQRFQLASFAVAKGVLEEQQGHLQAQPSCFLVLSNLNRSNAGHRAAGTTVLILGRNLFS